jgi:hypothetical protein
VNAISHALLGLLLLLGFLARPGWVVLVGALALTIASLEYVQARAGSFARVIDDPVHLKCLALNAGDSLAYCMLAYSVGWLAASILGFPFA